MRAPRTDLTGWTYEQIREHKNQKERERWAKNPEAGRARSRRHYAANPQKIMDQQKARQRAAPEGRRAIVRKSRHKNPTRLMLESAERRARKSGLPFTLTPEWARRTYKGRCALTDLEFTTHGRLTGKVSPFAPSLDQIVAGRGYTPDNSQFVLWSVNRFKSDMPIDTMYVIAKALLAKQP
jgi:hypothetical protein